MPAPEIRQVTIWRTRDGREFPTRAEAEEWLKVERLAKWLRANVPLPPSQYDQVAAALLSHFAIVPREPSP